MCIRDSNIIGDRDNNKNNQVVKTEDNHHHSSSNNNKTTNDTQPIRMIQSRGSTSILTGLGTQTVSSDSEPSAKRQRIEVTASPDLMGFPIEVLLLLLLLLLLLIIIIIIETYSYWCCC